MKGEQINIIKRVRIVVVAFAVAMVLGSVSTAFAGGLLIPPASDNWVKMPQIAYGNSNAAVRGCQFFLECKGKAPGVIDGAFGQNTKNAVVSYQTSKGLSADGIVGKNTWKAMRSDVYYSNQGSTNFSYTTGGSNNDCFLLKHTNNEPLQSSGGINSWWYNPRGSNTFYKMCD